MSLVLRSSELCCKDPRVILACLYGARGSAICRNRRLLRETAADRMAMALDDSAGHEGQTGAYVGSHL